MMMIDERLFDKEWLQDLPADARWLYLYILSKASKKTGIFEMNMRVLNFGAATEKKYTAEDLLKMYGGRIQKVPGHDSVGIVVDYIAKNWAPRNGGSDIVEGTKNPLYRSILSELARYGMTMEDVARMAGNRTGAPCEVPKPAPAAVVQKPATATGSGDETGEAFAAFWADYPGPRKTDKKKCADVFRSKAKAFKGSVSEFAAAVSEGLGRWKATEDWLKDGGRYICAPLVWLRNERWSAEVAPQKGGKDGNDRGVGARRSASGVYVDNAEADVFA